MLTTHSPTSPLDRPLDRPLDPLTDPEHLAPSHLSEDEATLQFACFRWSESLKASLRQKLFQNLTTERIHTLHKAMFHRIRKGLDRFLPLASRSERLMSSPHKDAIKNVFRKHLKMWLKDLVEKQFDNLLSLLLYDLLQDSSPRSSTKYEELLAFLLQSLRVCEAFIKHVRKRQQRRETADEVTDLSEHQKVKSLVDRWFREKWGKAQDLWDPWFQQLQKDDRKGLLQVLSEDLFSLVLNIEDSTQKNRAELKKNLLLLLMEIFPPGRLREVLQEGGSLEPRQDLLQPSCIQYLYRSEREQSLCECQQDFLRVLFNNLNQRMCLGKEPEELLGWLQDQTRHFFQDWLQRQSQEFHSAVRRHLQTPHSWILLLINCQLAVVKTPDRLRNKTWIDPLPDTMAAYCAASFFPTLRSNPLLDPCQVQLRNLFPVHFQHNGIGHVTAQHISIQQEMNWTVFVLMYHDWVRSLQQFLYKMLRLHSSTGQIQKLCQEMFTKIREDLRLCLDRGQTLLAERLEEIRPRRVQGAIEIGLRAHLNLWVKDLITEMIKNLTPDLLNSLLQDRDRFRDQHLKEASRRDPAVSAEYREILMSIFQQLKSTEGFEGLEQAATEEDLFSLFQKIGSLVGEYFLPMLLEYPAYQRLESEHRAQWISSLSKDLHVLTFFEIFSDILPRAHFKSLEETLNALLPKIVSEVLCQEALPPDLIQDPYMGLLRLLFLGSDWGNECVMTLEGFHKTCLYHLCIGMGICVTPSEMKQDGELVLNWLKTRFLRVFMKWCNNLYREENWASVVRRRLEEPRSRRALVRRLQLDIPSDLLHEELRPTPPVREELPPAPVRSEASSSEVETASKARERVFPMRRSRAHEEVSGLEPEGEPTG